MKVYLAARYSRREELVGYRNDLNQLGSIIPGLYLRVTSRWLNGSHEAHKLGPNGMRVIPRSGYTNTQARRFAREDLADIDEADVVVVFTEEHVPRGNVGRGGRHVEFGYALAKGKKIIVVGPIENVFYSLINESDLPGVRVADDWIEARRILLKWEQGDHA